MNSRERMIAILNGQKADKIPIFPKIAFSNIIACDNMHVIDYMTNSESMAKACIEAYKMFQWDAVALHTNIGSEGMALGSKYNQSVDAPSDIKEYLIETIEDFEQIKIPDPLTTEPMKTVIEATKIVKEQIGKEVYVTAWTNGPLNVASQVVPLDELLIGLVTEPEITHKMLDACTNVSITYAKELIKAGADAIAFGHAVASSSVISRGHYEEFALPYEKKLINEIHNANAKAITHICGNIEPIVDLIVQNGSDIIDFDHVCDIKKLRSLVGPNVVFRGNIDPTLLATGSSDAIREKIRELISQAKEDNNLILGTGCEVSLNTTKENLFSFVAAGREFGNL